MSFLNWFIDPIRNHYVDFSGRSTRTEFWMYMLVYFILAIVVSLFEKMIGTIFLTIIVSFFLMIPSLAISTRRLHDTGRSGWWQIIGFVPVLGLIVLAVLLSFKSETEPNQFGASDSYGYAG